MVTQAPARPERTGGKTMIETVFQALREDVLAGRRKPGERLHIERLRKEFGVSSSTVREALLLLVSETLATTEGQKGFRVVPASAKDFRAIAEMRVLLETKGLRESMIRGDDTWEAGVLAAFHRLSKVEAQMTGTVSADLAAQWEARNNDFHQALVAACDNPWLLRLRAILHQQSARYLRMSLTNRTVPRNVQAEHKAIMEATLARDPDRACVEINEHIMRTIKVVDALEQQGQMGVQAASAFAGG